MSFSSKRNGRSTILFPSKQRRPNAFQRCLVGTLPTVFSDSPSDGDSDRRRRPRRRGHGCRKQKSEREEALLSLFSSLSVKTRRVRRESSDRRSPLFFLFFTFLFPAPRPKREEKTRALPPFLHREQLTRSSLYAFSERQSENRNDDGPYRPALVRGRRRLGDVGWPSQNRPD